MTERFYRLLSRSYTLKERDIGEFAQIKGKGMCFDVRAFDVENGGSLCLLKMKGFFGLMKMESVVFSPAFRDAPIYSCDEIAAFGADTLILELYDTTSTHPDFGELQQVKDSFASLPDHDHGTHWYDSIRLPVSVYKKGKKLQAAFSEMFEAYSAEYLRLMDQCRPCTPEEKKVLDEEYVLGLMKNGGPAVDQFIKMIGEDKTAQFLKTVMFCCD